MRLTRISRRQLMYVPVLIGATALLFAKSLVYARLLPVDGFGALNQALLVAATFASFAGAGLQLLAHKLLPQYHGAGDTESADMLLSSAVGVFSIAVAGAAAAIGIAWLGGWIHGVSVWYATLLCAVSQYLFLLKLIEIKSELRFLRHGLLSLLRALFLLCAGAAAAAVWKDIVAVLVVEGAVTLVLAGEMFGRVRGWPIVRRGVKSQSQRQWLMRHLPAALRLLWLNSTVTVLYALDRWAGIALLTDREYGIYALGLIVVVVLETLQMVVNVSAYPLMGRMIAAGEHRRAFRFATAATLIVATGTAVFYAPFVILLDDLVRAWLPEYAEATSIIKVVAVAGALRLADFYGSFAILCDQERRLAMHFGVLIGFLVVTVAVIRATVAGRVDPGQIALLAVMISLCAFFVNLNVAWRALQSRSQPVNA